MGAAEQAAPEGPAAPEEPAGPAQGALRLRSMERDDWAAVAELIYVSTNFWYQASGKAAIFAGGPEVTELFCEVYEDLDPGRCVVAEHTRTGRLIGSCFYHPRETHVSLGIMNVHPAYFGTGVARRLLRFVAGYADRQGKPVRLVSSAMNLDSFSLYTRAGFVPRCAYQDVVLPVPAGGLSQRVPGGVPGRERVRPATVDDVPAMVALEDQISGIRRADDLHYFVENARSIWHISVLEGAGGGLDGFLASVCHPGSNMLGPGVARTEEDAAALLLAELDVHRGRSPVFLVPVEASRLVQQVYSWGGRNCELHFAQVRGACQPVRGITMPTFMPETG
jgi:GNAT superfamily N-acetyltransferase